MILSGTAQIAPRCTTISRVASFPLGSFTVSTRSLTSFPVKTSVLSIVSSLVPYDTSYYNVLLSHYSRKGMIAKADYCAGPGYWEGRRQGLKNCRL